jgi:hypothetical protein
MKKIRRYLEVAQSHIAQSIAGSRLHLLRLKQGVIVYK